MPMVLFKSAPAPLPVLLFAVLVKSVTAPTAALNLYIALEGNEPTAVLNAPPVRLSRAPCSSAVFPPA